MTSLRNIFLLPLVLLTGACATDLGIIDPITPEEQQAYQIRNVDVTYNPETAETIKAADAKYLEARDNVNEPLDQLLKSTIKSDLVERGLSGPQTADISVNIDNLKFTNLATVMLVGGYDQLAGEVVVYDTNTKAVIGEFYVDSIVGSGGLIGAATRGPDVRGRMINDFSDRIGDNFGLPEIQRIEEQKENIQEINAR